MAKSWYSIRNVKKGAAEVKIYDEIGLWGIRAADFSRDLKAAGDDLSEIIVRINSPGGAVFDGLAIHNILKDHAAKVTVKVDGIAASIASVIAMAGDRVEMPENAMMMIHDPSGLAFGTAEDMRELADVLDKIKASLVSAYRNKSGMSDDEIASMMAAETWLSAAEAKEKGLADEVTKAVKLAACADPDTLTNLNAPAAVLSAFSRQPAAPSNTDTKENAMSEKDKQPAGTTDAGADAQANAERDRAASIAKMCNEAGVPGLIDGLIAAGASVEDAKAKVNASAEIKTLCAQAKKLMPAMDVEAMAKEFSAKGVSPEVARAALWDKVAEASEAVNIVNTLSPQAVAQPGKQEAANGMDAAVAKANRLAGFAGK
jgi:ATP-dependent Clp endopeptidase proteolytic subunit ClpP